MTTDLQAVIEAGTLDSKSAQEIVAWAVKEFGSGLGLASSFGAEDVILIDMLVKADPKARIFTLDTGRLNQETYDVMDKIKEKYNCAIETYFPEASRVEGMVREKGFNLFYESIDNRKLCCNIRKVEPLNRALKGLKAWMTGLRREQVVTRAAVKKVEGDEGHHMYKINPLADWTWEEVWTYIRANKVPYNALHDQGYPSIGCEPCTRAVKPGEDFRAGRWWWERPEEKECGLHVKH